MKNLKSVLDKFYLDYDFRERLLHDPIEFPHRYKNPRDIEVAAFIASALAYGKVELFKPVVEKILSCMGTSPYEFLLEFSPEKHGRHFEGIKYRFNENEDLLALLFILHKLLSKHTNLEKVFMQFHRPDSPTIKEGLSGLVTVLLGINTSAVYGKDVRPAGLRQLFSSPVKHLYLRRQLNSHLIINVSLLALSLEF